jgi:RNA polymerase sigma factor for flagellar operon FliA
MTTVPDGSGEAAFLGHLPLVKEVIATVCRRHQITGNDAAEFSSSVFLKLIEDDYAVARRVRDSGDSRAFLFTVVYHHLLDCRNREWGRWRSTARARQLGSAAVFLERLIVRDRIHPQDAVAVLANHPRYELSSRDARDLHAQLNCRAPRVRPVELSDVEVRRVSAPAVNAVDLDQLHAETERIRTALRGAMTALPSDERRLLRLRFEEGRSVSDIAADLGVEAKPLYRRFERILQRLRRELERREMTPSIVKGLLGRERVEFASALPGSALPEQA